MKIRAQETLAVVGTVAVLVGTPVAIVGHGQNRSSQETGRVIVLTGVQKDGVWTDQEVTAVSFTVKRFRPATIVLREDERVTLRLTSADVSHSFYVPELGIGPVEVKAGKTREVTIEGAKPGVYTYYCTKVCGRCHHFMRGQVVVMTRSGERPKEPADAPPPGCAARTAAVPARRPELGRAARLFHEKGCVACHGEGGRGGVKNPNYIKDTVPNLDAMAERFMLFEEEDAERAIEWILSGTDVLATPGEEPWPRYAVFQAQYKAVYELIQNGNPAGKKDPNGIEPPLSMPHWGDVLADGEIREMIAYLLSLHNWEKEDEDEEEAEGEKDEEDEEGAEGEKNEEDEKDEEDEEDEEDAGG
jgi:plastocyanin/mono/diheme cytochrome c family protein